MHRRPSLAVVAFLAFAVAPARAEELADFLARAATATSRPVTLRASGTAAIDGVEGKRTEPVTLVERSRAAGQAGYDVEITLRHSRVERKIAARSTLGLDAAVGPLTFTAEDLLPFDPKRCHDVHVVDGQAERLSVTCEPAAASGSQYALAVWAFERERALPTQVLLYKGTMSNLVKRLKFDDYVEVGGRWRPRRITIRDYKLRTGDELHLEWRAEAAPPVAGDAGAVP